MVLLLVILTLRRLRQGDDRAFQSSLGLSSEFKASRNYIRRHCLENQTEKKISIYFEVSHRDTLFQIRLPPVLGLMVNEKVLFF